MTTTEPGLASTDASLDELGPVDYLVVEFPAGASNFTGEMANELIALVDAGTIRVIDILILTKNEDGSVEAVELSDVGELGELQAIEAQLAELLAEDDVVHLAAAMEPGSVAGVLIWAHPAVPDGFRSLAELFRERTEVGLTVYPPGTAPDSVDVFDYAEPTTAGDRLLFSARPVPPEQLRTPLFERLAARRVRVAAGHLRQ